MLQNCSTQKVLNCFFREPTKKYSLKEISIKSKIAHTSVKMILNDLIKEKLIILEKEIKGKRIFPVYFANVNCDYYKKLKKINNLKELLEIELIETIEEEFMPKSIILFGSFSKGEDIEGSDIDIFVESEENEINLKKFEKKLFRKINLYFGDLKKLNKNLKENIINGIVLEGFIEL
jgi:predicted nucleotidyltransferase